MTIHPAPFAPTIDGRKFERQPSNDMHATVHHLVMTAANGLLQMFDQEKQLFCYRLKTTDRGMVREGTSRRYSLITLLGLHQLEQAGLPSPINTEAVLTALS